MSTPKSATITGNTVTDRVGDDFHNVPFPAAFLFIYDRDGTTTHPLSPGKTLTVGRDAPSDLRIPDASVSRVHARFTFDGVTSVRIEDRASKNGTFVLRKRVTSVLTISADTVVRLGNAVCFVHIVRASVDLAPPLDHPPVMEGPAMQTIARLVKKLQTVSSSVFIRGETGSGKEEIARMLHAGGKRSESPLVVLNCAAISSQLVESTFFGHEKGAFTGATDRVKGYFEQADKGTLFLDEIGELSPTAQAALLRVLETGRFSRVGSTKEITVDVAILAATHRPIETMCERGLFREDLFRRLEVFTIVVPPLRERREDIAPLITRFIQAANRRFGRSIRDVAPDALELLLAYPWPGNVRELRNCIDYATAVAETQTITIGDLQDKFRVGSSIETTQESDASRPLRDSRDDFEAHTISDALRTTGGNRKEAAKLLGMALRTLHRRIKVLGIK